MRTILISLIITLMAYSAYAGPSRCTHDPSPDKPRPGIAPVLATDFSNGNHCDWLWECNRMHLRGNWRFENDAMIGASKKANEGFVGDRTIICFAGGTPIPVQDKSKFAFAFDVRKRSTGPDCQPGGYFAWDSSWESLSVGLPDNEVHKFVIAINNKTMELYLDGKLADSKLITYNKFLWGLMVFYSEVEFKNMKIGEINDLIK